MKAKYRLKKAEVFQDVFEKGAKNKYKNLFFINIKENTSNDCAKIGIAISKKHGHAPYRNHVKRQIRAILTNFNLDELENNDYVFVFSKKYCDADYEYKLNEFSQYYKELSNGKFRKKQEKRTK